MMREAASIAWYRHVQRLLHPPLYEDFWISKPRDMKCREIIGSTVNFDMNRPIVRNDARKLSYRFMAAEALWILFGSNDLSFHPQIREKLTPYSDNGQTMSGAYGPMVMQQVQHVVTSLINDEDSRQAALTIWKPNPAASRDIPCTLALQFLVRGGKMRLVASMRSSDIWMGLPYDMFTFSCIAKYVAMKLPGVNLKLENCMITAGSSHLYERNWTDAHRLAANKDVLDPLFDDVENNVHLFQWLNHAANADNESTAYKRLIYGET